MKQLFLLCLLFLCTSAFATNAVYLADSSAGGNTGADCANAKAHTYFNSSGNWSATPSGIQIGPDTTVHLCGTFTGTTNTSEFQFQGSGSSGHPVIIFFETGAVLTSAAWGTNGAIDLAGQNFITIDGGTLGNGKIQNTLAGDPGATCPGGACTQNIVTAGINSSVNSGSSALLVQNMTITNLYYKLQNLNNGVDDSICINFGGVNARYTNNVCDHSATGMGMAGISGTANQEIDHNTFSVCQHCIAAGTGTSAAADNIRIHDNDLGGGAYLWDNSNNNYHHNAIIIINETGFNPGITNLQIYNNYIHGLWSVTGHTTSMIFIDDYDTSQVQGLGFNNYINMDDASDAGTGNGVIVAGHQMEWYNNTVVTAFSDKCFNPPNYPTAKFKNNICSMVNPAVGFSIASGPTSGGTKPDYNLYYHVASWSYGTGADTFAQWLTECVCDSHAINGSDPKLNTNGTLQSGSPAIGVGVNLTSLGITELNTGKNGLARPSTGPWDVGAFPFSSSPISPTVTTTTASSITSAAAASGGTVTSDGGASVTSEGVCYATSASPTTPCTSDGTSTPFSSSLTGLSSSTLYHYRAFATNSVGTSYGSDLTFTTSAPATSSMTIKGGIKITGNIKLK